MSTKLDSVLNSTFRAMSRRRVLESLGALAATTACGSTSTPGDGGGTAGASPGAGGAGAGAGPTNTAGAAPSAGGAPSAGAPNTAAGAPSSAAGAAEGGVSNSAGAGTGGSATGGSAAGGAAGGSSAPLVPPSFDGVPETCTATPTTCMASPTDGAGQGPFFIHELEKSDDISLIRQDIRGRYNMDAAPGVEMQLHVRLLTSTGTGCTQTPVSGVEVYIWHTDGQGFYSGFGMHGGSDEQKPDTPYSGVPSSMNLENTDRFCRGVQTTDANGIVSFRSIFPGWYNGRVLHIHLVAFQKGSMSIGRKDYTKTSSPQWLYTTQFYFDKDFVRSVHEKYDPYKSRTSLADYTKSINAGTISSTDLEGAGQNCLGSAARTESTSSGLIAKATLANDIVVAQMNVLLKS